MHFNPVLTEKDIARFWALVDRSGGDDACWSWKGARHPENYGIFSLGNIRPTAHRISFVLHIGPQLSGQVIHHICNERSCVNPSHLDMITVAENNRIRQASGRTRGRAGDKNAQPLEYCRPDSYRGRGGITIPPEERFWSHVDKQDGENSCWLWTAARTKTGHGRFWLKSDRGRKKLIPAYRYAYELLIGPIPEHMNVCHNCPGGDNPSCVRPDHMFIGTQGDNMRDAAVKGKLGQARGERQHKAKLNEADVVYIRQQHRRQAKSGPHSNAVLADKFGVSPSTIALIVARKSWKHLL